MRRPCLVLVALLVSLAAGPLAAQEAAQVRRVRFATVDDTLILGARPALAGARVATYRREAGWIGFGLGAVTAVILWTTCDGCGTGQKTLYGTSTLVGGALLGSLIGAQIHK